ncbi:hypothetical protein PR048_029078 [Dryococelus australis]|uniref:Uncharacterized protein n=1 Tax=Dryococelus australis TaxID=614101 RepID=A0ABQ9GCC4_9NEOP|nr:hypothetical protein PR048_029078 [Dryococelus australis]
MEWLQEEWRRIPGDVLQTLIESMPDRVSVEQRRNARAEETRDPRENPPSSPWLEVNASPAAVLRPQIDSCELWRYVAISIDKLLEVSEEPNISNGVAVATTCKPGRHEKRHETKNTTSRMKPANKTFEVICTHREEGVRKEWEGIGTGLYYGPITALVWSDFGKPWKNEIRMAGPGIEPVSSRMRMTFKRTAIHIATWRTWHWKLVSQCGSSTLHMSVERKLLKCFQIGGYDAAVHAGNFQMESLPSRFNTLTRTCCTYQTNQVTDEGTIVVPLTGPCFPAFTHIQGQWGKREIPEKTRRPTVSTGTILTCENPDARCEQRKPCIVTGPWRGGSWGLSTWSHVAMAMSSRELGLAALNESGCPTRRTDVSLRPEERTDEARDERKNDDGWEGGGTGSIPRKPAARVSVRCVPQTRSLAE